MLQEVMRFEDDVDAELWIEAIRDIMPGEELTIDYAWPADRGAKCLCGSPQCRGWIVDPAELHLLQDNNID
jgi:SET domain-containing protein